jgi:glyoxylase-like metal-dependent hydrolase (beta-lactamase superfamily II)
MRIRKALLCLIVLALAAVPAVLAQAPTPTPDHHERSPQDIFKVKPLSGGVYALYGRGGNIGFFVGPDAVLVIDSQFKDIAPGIVAEIKKVTDKPIRFLVNTHHHGDHVGGNDVFRQFALIVAHDNVRKHMLASPQDIQKEYPALIENAKKAGNDAFVKNLTEQLEWAKTVKVEEIPAPVMTFDSEMRLYMGAETIQVWHLPPAHTDGDSVVYFEKANVLHMGDDFFNKVIPFIDQSHGGSVKGYVAAIDKVIARVPPNVTVIPGHGEISDVAGLKVLRQYMVDIGAAAQRARSAGQSKDDFLKAVDLPAYKDWSGYKDRFKANCGTAYDEAK